MSAKYRFILIALTAAWTYILVQYLIALGYEKATGYPSFFEPIHDALIISSPLWVVAFTPNAFPLVLHLTRLFALLVMAFPTIIMSVVLLMGLKEYLFEQTMFLEIGATIGATTAIEVICVSLVVVLCRLKSPFHEQSDKRL